MKKIICNLLCLCLLLLSIPSTYVQATPQADTSIEIPLTIKENNDIYVSESLYRRGFALPEGAVFSMDAFGLYDKEGRAIPSVFEVTEKYRDGSIKWALCSFVTELKKSERKELVIKNVGSTAIENPVTVNTKNLSCEMKNNLVTIQIDSTGIKTLSYNHSEFTQNIGGYITLDGQSETALKIEEIEVIKQNDLYAKVCAKGVFADFARGEIVVTLASGAKKADIEYRITSRKDLNIYSMGMKIVPNGMAGFSYSDTEYQANNIVGSDYIYAKQGDTGVYFITRDNRRFRTATTSANNTGFIFGSDAIKFAPIVNRKTFLWYDGLTRTTHLLASFEENAAEQIKTLEHAPSIEVDPQAFESAGVIELAGSCAPIDRIISMVNFDLDKRDGRLDAGAMHYGIDPDTESFSSLDTHPGEMEYNLGTAYMATADSGVYTVLTESAEFWADIEVYKGDIQQIYGANRYRTGPQYYNERFRTSHPYYGDSSGLYMAYVLSGNEYIRDIYKISIEHIYNNMYSADKNSGYHYPHMYQWYDGNVQYRPYVESRYMIQARPLYLAYGLFEEEKYRDAALEISHWAYAAQSEDGWWYQAIWDTGEPLRQNGQTQDAVKTYVWMYGARGISFLSRYEQTDEIRAVLERIGNFIDTEYKKYGKGLWKPTGDVNLYEMDEDKTRSKGPYEDIMGIELLYRAYQLTGKEQYLKSLLDCTETWLSSMNPGGASVLLSNMEGYGTTHVMGGGQNYTLLMIFPELRKLFREKEQLIRDWGFDYLLTAIGDGAKMYEGKVEKVGIIEPELTQIIFENGEDKVLFATNHVGYLSGSYEKDYYTNIPEGGLWKGVENQISLPGKVTLHQYMKQFDRILATYTPITITGLSNPITAYVDEYNEKEIVFRVYGEGELSVKIDSGRFAIHDGNRYSVTVSRDGENGARIRVCKNCIKNLKAAEDGLRFKITLQRKLSLLDTEKVSAYAMVSEGLMSATNFNFRPEEAADENEFAQAAEKITGIQQEFNGTTYREAADYTLEMLERAGDDFFNQYDIIKRNMTVIGTEISDDEAVRLGADLLKLPEFEKLGGDIELPTESVADTTVTWQSSNEAVLSGKGVLNRTAVGVGSVTLTATVKRGNASAERSFEIPIMDTGEVNWYANTQNISENQHELKQMSGEFEINFDLTPAENNTNAVVGFSSTDAVTALFSDFPMIIRCSPDGILDAYNGNTYAAIEQVPYQAGKKYHIRMQVSLDRKKYSVFVTPDGESSKVIAENFDFRATAPEIGNVDVVYLPTAKSGTRLFRIDYIDCARLVKEDTVSSPLYDSNGFMFGQYAQKSIYLPSYYENEKISWVISDHTVVDENGIVTLKNGTMDITLYGVKGTDRVHTSADILRELKLIEQTEDADAIFTRAQAADLLNAMRYVMK